MKLVVLVSLNDLNHVKIKNYKIVIKGETFVSVKMEISLDKNITLTQCTQQRKLSSTQVSYQESQPKKQSRNSNSNKSTESEEWIGGGRMKRWGRRRCRRCRSQHSALRSANIVQHNTELDSPNFTIICDRIHTRASQPHFAQQNVSFVALFSTIFHYC